MNDENSLIQVSAYTWMPLMQIVAVFIIFADLLVSLFTIFGSL